jgi:hypothetical protein
VGRPGRRRPAQARRLDHRHRRRADPAGGRDAAGHRSPRRRGCCRSAGCAGRDAETPGAGARRPSRRPRRPRRDAAPDPGASWAGCRAGPGRAGRTPAGGEPAPQQVRRLRPLRAPGARAERAADPDGRRPAGGRWASSRACRFGGPPGRPAQRPGPQQRAPPGEPERPARTRRDVRGRERKERHRTGVRRTAGGRGRRIGRAQGHRPDGDVRRDGTNHRSRHPPSTRADGARRGPRRWTTATSRTRPGPGACSGPACC